MNEQEIQLRMDEIRSRLAVKDALYQEQIKSVRALEEEIANLTIEVDILAKTTAVLLMISSKVLGQSTETIDKLVTAGLRLTFDDQDLQFKTRVEKMRGKTALKFDLYQDGRAVPLANSYGGGVLVTAGVLLRVVTIMVLGLKRMLILDESLSHLHSVRYQTNLSKLLKKVATELNFMVLLVTDEQEFATEADKHYIMEKKGAETTAREVVKA